MSKAKRRSSRQYTSGATLAVAPPSVSHRWQSFAELVVLLVATLLAYLPVLHGSFVWDDDRLLTGNDLIQAPDGLSRIWFTTEPVDYWPVTNSSFWLEWRLWGASPYGYHTTNLTLHFLSALLVWAVLQIVDSRSISGRFIVRCPSGNRGIRGLDLPAKQRIVDGLLLAVVPVVFVL